MKIFYLITLAALLCGCGETTVDTAPFREASDKVAEARAAAEKLVADARRIEQSVQQAGIYTADAKAFVDRCLASSNERVQEAARPILKLAVLKDPTARAIIFAQLKEKAKAGSKKAEEMLQDLKAITQSVAQ